MQRQSHVGCVCSQCKGKTNWICINKECALKRQYLLAIEDQCYVEHNQEVVEYLDFVVWENKGLLKLRKLKDILNQIESKISSLNTIRLTLNDFFDFNTSRFITKKIEKLHEIDEFDTLMNKHLKSLLDYVTKLNTCLNSLNQQLNKGLNGNIYGSQRIFQTYTQSQYLILKEKLPVQKFNKSLYQDINECLPKKEQQFLIFPNKYNLSHIKVFFYGAKGTIFDNGIYEFDLQFKNNYRFHPPKCIFLTQIYHPNIKNQGISVDILNSDQWSIIFTIEKIIISIISLLDDPNPDFPLDLECATQYKNDRESYNQIVQEQKLKYASPIVDDLVIKIVEQKTNPDYVYLKGLFTEWIEYWRNFQ